ncbi:hypothetical protein STEG23_005934, partial [Scotinomys teguina]
MKRRRCRTYRSGNQSDFLLSLQFLKACGAEVWIMGTHPESGTKRGIIHGKIDAEQRGQPETEIHLTHVS